MDEFARLIGVAADPTNPEMNSAMSALIEMSQRNRIQFLDFCVQFLQAPMLPPQQYLMCLSAAKETTKIRNRSQRKEIRDAYDENREVVEALKLSILPFLANENDPLRNMAAVTAATIFEIEMQKWSSLLDILVEILGSTSHSACHKVGAITVFHEILGLVTFSDVPPQLVEFLRLLTVFLTSNDVPLYFLKLSGDCLLEIVKKFLRKFPGILDDQVRIEAVWSIYPAVLPKSDYELYVTLHRVLIRILKSFYENEMKKTEFTRLAAAIVYPFGVYAVYNTRDEAMLWRGRGEEKAQILLSSVFRDGGFRFEVQSAVLFGKDFRAAAKTLEDAFSRRFLNERLDKVYQHLHFIPMNENGMKMLEIITLDDWQNKLGKSLYGYGMIGTNSSGIEYDANVEGVFHYCHLDGDLCRLIRFRSTLRKWPEQRFVLDCYREQIPYLREYLGDYWSKENLRVRVIKLESIHTHFCGAKNKTTTE